MGDLRKKAHMNKVKLKVPSAQDEEVTYKYNAGVDRREDVEC